MMTLRTRWDHLCFGFDEELSGTNNDSGRHSQLLQFRHHLLRRAVPLHGAQRMRPPPAETGPRCSICFCTVYRLLLREPLPYLQPRLSSKGQRLAHFQSRLFVALACDATTWSPSDLNDGVRYIFQRLNGVEAATCAMSLRFTFTPHSLMLRSLHVCSGMKLMKNPHSSLQRRGSSQASLKNLLLSTLKIHAPDIYYMRYADQDESAYVHITTPHEL